MNSLFVATAVVAVTEFVKRVQAKDVSGAVTILAAAVIGLLAGLGHVEGLSVSNGLIAGLTAAGLHTVASQIGS